MRTEVQHTPIWPGKWQRPCIQEVRLDGCPPYFHATCWCGWERLVAGGRESAEQLADQHSADHPRPSFWVRRAVNKLAQRMQQWAKARGDS